MLILSTYRCIIINIEMKKSYHTKDLKEKLIQEGLKLINAEGFNNFSMRKLSAICNISHNGPYKHFKNREDFLKTILERAITEFQNCLQEPLSNPEKNPTEKLIDLGLSYITFFVNKPEFYTIFFNSKLKGNLYVDRGNFTYNKVHLFSFLDTAVKEHMDFINRINSFNKLLVLEFWSTVHGLTSFIITDKVIFKDGYTGYARKMIERIISGI